MSERVVVTGVGVVAPALIGGWERLAAFLDAAPAAEAEARLAPEALGLLVDEGEARRLSRVCQFTVAATRLALADAGLEPGSDLGLVMGTEFGDLRSTMEFADGYLDRGPAGLSALLFPSTVMNTMVAATAIAVGARAATLTLNVPAVAGELAVARAAATIAAGRSERVLTGGVDELDALRGRLLVELGAAEEWRSEGATVLVLESRAAARARGARILAEVRGAAWGALPARPHGVGRTRASRLIARVTGQAGLAPRDLRWVYTSTSRDLAREQWEHAVLDDAFGGQVPPRAALARLVGQCAASGALRVAAAAWTARNGRLVAGARDPRADVAGPGLVHALARGGTHVALVLAHDGD